MPTLSACPACRTAVPPGAASCLRCGHSVDEPPRPCPSCRQPAAQDARYCTHCGAALDTALPADTGTSSVTVADVFPEPPSYRRPMLVGASVLGVLVLVLAMLDVVEWRFFRPQAAITAYFDALADRDAARAGSLLDDANVDLLDRAALKSDDYTPPTDVWVGDVETAEDGSATAEVGFTLGGQRREMTMSLVRDGGRAAGLFPQWRIVDGTYRVTVYAPGVQSVVLAGVSVPIAQDVGMGMDGTAIAAVYPGEYLARLPTQPLFVAEPVTVQAGTADTERHAAVEIVPTVAPTARQKVEQLVREHVDECATKTVLSPEGCPFSTYGAFGEVQDVRWKITSYPSVAVELDSSGIGAVTVHTMQPGVAEVTYRQVYLGTSYSETDTSQIDVRGTVAATGNALTFTPSRGFY